MSFGELVLLGIIAVLALGAGRLPEAGRIVGKGLRNFHRGMREARDVLSQDAESSGPTASRPRRLID
ncbi:MAG TPA: twin-arginine translocase TatA/TatE family subunit [Gemmatimonadales bacterium]|nr:twin-arginine translocase TatA/TatE family subunit [Gemmatimonadales bacterium]